MPIHSNFAAFIAGGKCKQKLKYNEANPTQSLPLYGLRTNCVWFMDDCNHQTRKIQIEYMQAIIS